MKIIRLMVSVLIGWAGVDLQVLNAETAKNNRLDLWASCLPTPPKKPSSPTPSPSPKPSPSVVS